MTGAFPGPRARPADAISAPSVATVGAVGERSPASGCRDGDHLAQLCSAGQWTPSVLDKAAQLIFLAAPHDVAHIAEVRLLRAARMAR